MFFKYFLVSQFLFSSFSLDTFVAPESRIRFWAVPDIFTMPEKHANKDLKNAIEKAEKIKSYNYDWTLNDVTVN